MLQVKTIVHTDWRTNKRRSQEGCVFSTEDVAKVEHELRDDLKDMQSAGLPDEIFRHRWRRTLLQHAWASISHDRIYKSSIRVPEHLKRELARVAAFLEEADEQFGASVRSLDAYKLHYGAIGRR